MAKLIDKSAKTVATILQIIHSDLLESKYTTVDGDFGERLA